MRYNIKKIDGSYEINNEINRFFKNLFAKTLRKLLHQVNKLFQNTILPVLIQEQNQDCEKEISEKEVTVALKSFSNNESTGNNSLTKKFYKAFWSESKELFMNSISQIKIGKRFITSWRQAVIKLIEKKGKGKRFIKIWRPISLLNVDCKM